MKLGNNFIYSGLSFLCKGFNNIFLAFVLYKLLYLSNTTVYLYLLTLIGFLVNVSDFGFGMYLIRECNSKKQQLSNLIIQVNLSKVFLFLFCLLLVYIFFLFRSDYPLPLWVVFLFLFNALFVTLTNTCIAVFQTNNKFNFETVCLFVFTGLLLVGVFVLYFFPKLRILLLFHSVANLVMFLTSIFLLNKLVPFDKNNFYLNLKSIQTIIVSRLIEVKIFALIIIGDILFSSLDILLSEYFIHIHDFGIYMICSKLILAACFFPILLYSVLQPAIREKIINNNLSKFDVINYLSISGLLGIFIAFLFYILLDPLTKFLLDSDYYGFSDFRVTDFKLEMSLIIWLRYLIVIPAVILAMGNQFKLRAQSLWITILLSLFGYFYFITTYGISGSFLVCVLSHVLLVSLYLKNIFSKNINTSLA